MNYLIDTHILLWSLLDTGKLSKNATAVLLNESCAIYYSPISLWEISIKYGLKKLTLHGGTPEDIFNEINNSFYLCKTPDALGLATNYKLTIRHKDPFDRFLIWEAIRNNFTLISADEDMKLYEEDGLKLLY